MAVSVQMRSNREVSIRQVLCRVESGVELSRVACDWWPDLVASLPVAGTLVRF